MGLFIDEKAEALDHVGIGVSPEGFRSGWMDSYVDFPM